MYTIMCIQSFMLQLMYWPRNMMLARQPRLCSYQLFCCWLHFFILFYLFIFFFPRAPSTATASLMWISDCLVIEFYVPLLISSFLLPSQSQPRWRSLQQPLLPSHHPQARGAWTLHQGPLDHLPLRCPCPQSCSPPPLHYFKTRLCFASFSQHFRLPCS